MNPIKAEFEQWYINTEMTYRQRQVLLETNDSGDYIYMQTVLTYNAFKAGWTTSRSYK